MPASPDLLTYGDGQVLPVQPTADDSPFGADPAPVGRSDPGQQLHGRVEDSIERIRGFGQMAIDRLTGGVRPPQKVTVQLQVKVSAELGVMLAKSSGEANFTVTMEWHAA